jgi:NAD(P)-dependent dehydrogenase (short-subunit alcohol dehydrogenase family)
MVDSITPATDATLLARVSAATGLEDAAAVQRERFSQWVIEDVLPQGGPDLASVGVVMTHDVAGFERAKLRILNGALFELYNTAREQAGLKAAEPGDATQGFMSLAVLSLSDSFLYPSPALLQLADFTQVLNVNLIGAFIVGKAVAQAMIASGTRGSIIHISSVGAVLGVETSPAYCTSKGGLGMLTKVMALAMARHGVARRTEVTPARSILKRFRIQLPEAMELRRLLLMTSGRINLTGSKTLTCQRGRVTRIAMRAAGRGRQGGGAPFAGTGSGPPLA